MVINELMVLYLATFVAFFFIQKIMGQIRKSITINDNVNSEIEKQAEIEGRSFSNMVEQMAKKYLDNEREKVLEKPKT